MEADRSYRGLLSPEYGNKVVLAPMVRVGTLPFRLLALEQGADIVYSEEIIAQKLQNTVRVVNEQSNTIDFLLKDKDGSAKPNTAAFRTNKADHPNIVQLGASDAVTALKAASIVSRDVNGIDFNMGCPKHFSVQGGMGAALLKQPETVKDILSTLKRNLTNPISCKIRLLSTVSATIDLLKIIEQTGVSAVAIHSRFVHERPRDSAHWDLATEVIANCGLNIPIIINGDVYSHGDIAKVKTQTGASSVMIARGALLNASIFNPQQQHVDEIVKKYLQHCIDLDNGWHNTKYVVLQILQAQKTRHPQEDFVIQTKDMKTLCTGWGLEDVYVRKYSNSKHLSVSEENEESPCKKAKCGLE